MRKHLFIMVTAGMAFFFRPGINAASLGPVVSYSTSGQTVQFTMQNGTMNMTVCTPKIIRVWCTPGSTFAAKSFTAVSKTSWDAASFTVTEPAGAVQIATSAIALSVNKSSGAIT
jgi:hypothetical protein